MMYTRKAISYWIVGFALVFATTSSSSTSSSTTHDNNENQGDAASTSREEEAREHVRVPVIDLAPWFDPKARVANTTGLGEAQRDNIVHQIRRACREVGFFQITGGLGSKPSSNDEDDANEIQIQNENDDAMIRRTWKASKDFFDLPLDEKLRHTTADATSYPYGYERSETLVRGKLLDGKEDGATPSEEGIGAAAAAAADLKETFSLGPPDNSGSGMPPRRWIDSAPNVNPENASVPSGGNSPFQTSLEAYYERMEDLALTLLEIFAIALDESPDFFKDKMDHHMSALRLVHYYPLEQQQQQQQHKNTSKNNKNQTTKTNTNTTPPHTGKPSKEQRAPIPIQRVVRAGAHTDYGALTILAAQDEGLEVLLRDTTSGVQQQQQQWYPVPLIQGAFVVNLGDLMQRWTNNEWISTMHRVVMPATEAREQRYSMAYFVNINGDTPIEPLKCCRGSSNDENVHTNGRVITAGEHLMAKHLASMGMGMEDDDGKAETVSNEDNTTTNNSMEKESCDASE